MGRTDPVDRIRRKAATRARERGFPSVAAMAAADRKAEQTAELALRAAGWNLAALPPELLDAGRRVLAMRAHVMAYQDALARKMDRIRADAAYAYREVARDLAALALDRDPGPAVWRAVDRALSDARDPKDRRRKDPLAARALEDPNAGRDRLARAVVGHLNRLLAALTLDAPDTPPEHAGMLAMDARFADYLERLGAEGERLAALVKPKARDRWTAYQAGELAPPGRLLRLWLDLDAEPRAPWLVLLALAVWQDVVRPELERRERYRPAIQAVHLDALTDALWDPRRSVEFDPDARKLVVLDAAGTPVARVARVDPDLLQAMQDWLLRGTRNADFLRVFGTVLHLAHLARAKDPDARELIIPEGLSGMCKLARVPKRERVRRVLELGQCIILETPTMTAGGIWTWDLERERRYKACSRLRVAPAPWFLPPRVGGHLVPLLPPDREPGLPTQRKLHGPALLVVQRVLALLRRHAPELVKRGHVPLAAAAWEELGRAVGVSARTLDSIRGPLLDGDSRRPPLLAEPVRGRADLARDYADIREFLLEGGRRTLRARGAGRKGARKRWSGTRRRGRRRRP